MPNMLGKNPFAHPLATQQILHFPELVAHLDAAPGLPNAPVACDWRGGIPDNAWGALYNDRYGDCTVAAADHMLKCWSANTQAAAWSFDPDDAKADFDNYRTDADSSATFNILDGWRHGGFLRRDGAGGARVRIDDFALLDINHATPLRTQVEQAIYLFGGCYIGFVLPVYAMTVDPATGKTVGRSPDWNLSAAELAAKGDAAKPAAGAGHCVNAVGYDQNALKVITWGAATDMSWDFFQKYMDEAWVILCAAAWVDQNGLTPSGLSQAVLVQDFAALKKAGQG